MTASTSFIDWAPTRFLPETGVWRWVKMPTWLDEQYMWMAVITLIGFAWILYRFGFVPEELSDGGAAQKELLSAGPGVPATDKAPDAALKNEKAAARRRHPQGVSAGDVRIETARAGRQAQRARQEVARGSQG